MTNPSTQLRALEGEIAELENAPSSIRQFRKSKLCDKAITIAKELEKHVLSIDYSCEQLGERVEQLTIENQDLRAENATLKQRLDEAMNVANRLATVAKHHRARGQKVGKKAIQSYDNLLKANPEYSPHERFRNRATPAA